MLATLLEHPVLVGLALVFGFWFFHDLMMLIFAAKADKRGPNN